jgi:predicted transcriptional regulator
MSKTGARIARARENQTKAFELRKLGFTYAVIAQKLEVSPAQAFNYIKHALAELTKLTLSNAEDLRRLELERLDQLDAEAVRHGVKNKHTSLNVINTRLRISERRCKLLGIDAQTKIELTGKDGGPVQFAKLNLSKLSDQELSELQAIIAKTSEPTDETTKP